MSHNGVRAVVGIVFVGLLPSILIAQSPSPGAVVGPLSDEPRFDAPFSARATLNLVQRTDNGGELRRTLITNHFRDSRGRVRIEYAVDTDSAGPRQLVLLVPNPYAPRDRLFLIDDVEKLIEWVDLRFFQRFFNASSAFSIPTGLRRFTVFRTANVHAPEASGLLEDLGSRLVGELEVRGLRFSSNGFKEVDVRWESPQLGVVVYARHVDTQTEIEYTLSDIRRAEPDQALFLMPTGYRYKHDGSVVLDGPLAELRRLELR